MKDSTSATLTAAFAVVCVFIGFMIGHIMTKRSLQSITNATVWTMIQEKIDKKEIYFAASVEDMMKQSMAIDIKRGFDLGCDWCLNPAPRITIAHKLLPHGVEITDTLILNVP